jgi:hypothetical protein
MLLAQPVLAQSAGDEVLEQAGAAGADANATLPASACDPAEAAELRAHLGGQASHARKWNIGWAVAFGTAAVATGTVGFINPLPDMQTGLYVSAGKASIGALARLILPLRIPLPEASADACADVAALRKAVALAAKRERGNFYLNHIGGIVVNGGGAAIIYWKTDSIGQALLSVAIGYPIGLISNYTGPRGSWRLYRERKQTWTTAVIPHEHGWTLGVAGTF